MTDHQAKQFVLTKILRPVWVVGLQAQQGHFLMMAWTPMLGRIVGSSGGLILVEIEKAYKSPWARRPSEVWDTEEEAYEAAKERYELQRTML